jgi:chaperonin cofactor prefoldin
MSGFGVRVQPKDIDKLEWRFTQQFEKRIDNLNNRIKDIENEPKYSDEERDQMIEELELRIEAIEDMREDALDEAYGG